MIEFWVPEQSTGEITTLDMLEAKDVKLGIAQWTALCGERRFPAEPVPWLLGLLLRNIILVRVLEDGNDYEYRIVGNALVEGGFGENFAGRRLSAITSDLPRFGIGLRMLYDMVRGSGEPLFYRGWAGRDMPGARFVYYESAILPFGADDVDHILVVSALVPREGLYPAMPQSLRA
jgi:hypothetical protein